MGYHFYRCFMFLLCLNYFMSFCYYCCFLWVGSWVWWYINFFNSFILISFNFNSFSFYFNISNFFYSYTFFCDNSDSIFWILSFQVLSVYLFSFSSSAIWWSSCCIISCVTLLFWFCWGLLAFSLFSFIFCYIYFILDCFVMYISWFLRRTRSSYSNFYERCLQSYFAFDICYFKFFTFYSYSLSFFINFKAFVCSLFTLIKPSFSSCKVFNYFCKFFN